MKLQLPNYYEFNHDSVKNKFESSPEYVATFTIKGEYYPVAVYSVENPNREKGHKDYLLLQIADEGKNLLVRGMDKEDMEPYLEQTGIHCQTCDAVIYSVNRHDYRRCQCSDEDTAVFADGGRDYLKVAYGDKGGFKIVKINFKTRDVSIEEDDEDRKENDWNEIEGKVESSEDTLLLTEDSAEEES